MQYRWFSLFLFVLLILGSCNAARDVGPSTTSEVVTPSRGVRTEKTPPDVGGAVYREILPSSGNTYSTFVHWRAKCVQPDGWHPTQDPPWPNWHLPLNAACGYTSNSGTDEVIVLVEHADEWGLYHVQKTPLATRIREFLPSELVKPKISVSEVRIEKRSTRNETASLSWHADASEYEPAENGTVIVQRQWNDLLLVVTYHHTGDVKADEFDLTAFTRNIELQ